MGSIILSLILMAIIAIFKQIGKAIKKSLSSKPQPYTPTTTPSAWQQQPINNNPQPDPYLPLFSELYDKHPDSLETIVPETENYTSDNTIDAEEPLNENTASISAPNITIGLGEPFDMRRAVIYSEILNRPYA